MAENTDIPLEDSNINVLYELQHSTLASDLIQHHRFVQEHYEAYNNNREINHNFVRGFHYDPNELKRYRDKKKTPIVFNQIKTSERTILGMWLNSKYAVKFAATSPASDDIGEILEQLNIWEIEQQEDELNDIDTVRQAWAGGNSFQECYMDVKPGTDPKMHTNVQNSFAIYWDPESRQLIKRDDALFVDRDSFSNYPALARKFPEQKKQLKEQLGNRAGTTAYDNTNVYADRDHEVRKERNGVFLVTERFYKVDGLVHFAEMNGERIDIDDEDLKDFKKQYPNIIIQKEYAEELWLAIVCEAYNNNEYLYNGKYHCQPRDPRTKKIIWPILEMVAESLAGEPQGFVDHERSPNKIIDAMMSNILSSATHSAASSILLDAAAFVSEKEAKLAARHHSDSDRAFKVRPGRTNDAMKPIEKSQTNQDHQYALNYSLSFLSEVSSATPALQGQQESANTPASLNAQRIQQGAVQLQPFMKNFRIFLKQRAKLRYYYWRTYYTTEMTFRVIDKTKPEMDPYITINQKVPELDALGSWTGAIRKMKDINVAEYDISIEEATDSPTYRDRQLAFIDRMMGSAFVKSDVGLAAGLLEEALRLNDAPAATRDFLKKYSNIIQQANIQQKQLEVQRTGVQVQSGELDNEQKMQNIAQQEAEQTGFPVENGEFTEQGAPEYNQQESAYV